MSTVLKAVLACILCAASSCSSEPPEKGQRIPGSYEAFLVHENGRYAITLKSFPKDLVDAYSHHKPNVTGDRVVLLIDVATRQRRQRYGLFVYSEHWTLRKGSKAGLFDLEIAHGKVDYPSARSDAIISFESNLLPGSIERLWNHRRFMPQAPLKEMHVSLIGMTLKEGIEGYLAVSGALDDPSERERNETFRETVASARQADVDIADHLGDYFAAGWNGRYFFLLFFNASRTIGCDRQYMIQRVKIKKEGFDRSGSPANEPSLSYLVEIYKLDYASESKGGDRHVRCYRLGAAYSRTTTIEVETGWGTIPGVVESKEWPYDKHTLYQKLQDYSTEPGLYNDVVYQCSTAYKCTFTFSKSGEYTVDFPPFVNAR